MVAIILAAGGFLALSAPALAQQALPYNQRLEAQNAGRYWSYRQANGEHWFELRPGDYLPGDGPTKERSEIFSAQKLKAGLTYEIQFSVMIEPGPRNTAPWLTLSQLQSTFDRGEAGHSPPFALELVGEKMRIVTRDSAPRISTPDNTHFVNQYVDRTDIARGKWYHFRILVKLNPVADGSLVVWRNGNRLVNYTGPIGFNDLVGSYFKEGLYRGSSAEQIAAQFKGPVIKQVGQ